MLFPAGDTGAPAAEIEFNVSPDDVDHVFTFSSQIDKRRIVVVYVTTNGFTKTVLITDAEEQEAELIEAQAKERRMTKLKRTNTQVTKIENTKKSRRHAGVEELALEL